MAKITHKKLFELLHYDSEKGEFTSRATGKIVGHWNHHSRETTGFLSYWKIYVCGKTYYRGKLAWFYMTGKWPVEEIDHVDRNSLNDRWSNLREATHAQNQMNRRLFKNNRSGHKGVHWYNGKWRAMISIDGRNKHIGYFDRFEDAKNAYVGKVRESYAQFVRV